MRPTPILLAAAALLVAGCAALSPTASTDGPRRVVLAIQPTDNAETIEAQAPELERFLEARMAARGVEADVEIVVPLSYIGVVETLRYGHTDAALMGAWPMAVASAKAGAEVVLAEAREVVHGDAPVVAPHYFSSYVVLEGSPYGTLADLRGKAVAFPSSSSTSGYIFPVARLVQDGLVPAPAAGAEAKPDAFFGDVVFAGGYAQAWEALWQGRVDVAVVAGDVNQELHREVLAATRVVAQQGPVPSHGVVFAKGFQGSARDALLQAFLDVEGEERDLMRKLVSALFVEFRPTTTEEHVAPLAEALRLTGLRLTEKIG